MTAKLDDNNKIKMTTTPAPDTAKKANSSATAIDFKAANQLRMTLLLVLLL